MTQTWWESWHGAKLSTAAIQGGGGSAEGGSTAMSTGVTNALSTKAGVGHTHGAADISSLASTLAGLAAAISTKAAGVHTHAQGDVTNLESTLVALEAKISTKAAGSHTHPQADVTNLTSTLAALSAQISTKAAGSHSHAQAEVTDLTSTIAALDARMVTLESAPPGGGGGIPSTWVTLSTHVLTGSTTMQSVTGLSFAVSSASMYRFEFCGAYQAISSATGIAFGVNGPAAPLMLVYEAAISSGLGGSLLRNGRAFGVQTLASPGSSAANLDSYWYFGGVCRTGANAGTLQLQCASEVAGSTVSVRAGSVGLLFGGL
jgi:hypothetical protein